MARPEGSTTKDWELHAWLDWKPIMHEETCDYCNGRGEIGGGFKDLDGARQCPTCHGRGTVLKNPTTEKPEMPPSLVEHMRRAWWDYWNDPRFESMRPKPPNIS